ncbi:secondary thiamine-phosphate synthase enzyme YjbQ [Aliiglaciecola sp. SL4]|uniref:secondary thiamine-phosphate synthase enzyme YjbQ n=1 Tax=Aliiglaciecola sp. SL4 TaxID=3239806 RepID=UPI00355B4A07
MWIQKRITIRVKARGFHLITKEILDQLPEIREVEIGMLNLFIQHTSASLTINENADPTVRIDLETQINRMIPEGSEHYLHNIEGDDDMPAHIKASIFGNNLNIPIDAGKLATGTWQGIYLGEHRDHGTQRVIVATLQGLDKSV